MRVAFPLSDESTGDARVCHASTRMWLPRIVFVWLSLVWVRCVV